MLKPGDTVHLAIHGRPGQDYRVRGVGPYTVRVVDTDGIEFDVPRRTIAKQVEGTGLTPYPVAGRPNEISTPMGGQPKKRVKRRASRRRKRKP